jgi:phage baseplate assembly protein W
VAKEFLGKGWRFPIAVNERGGISTSECNEKVRQSILVILGTAKGERVMRPEFGCGVHDFVFSTVNTSTLTLIKSAVKEALVLWEPRIEVLAVKASARLSSEGIVDVCVDYRVRGTNTEFNMVYPFYLKAGTGE